MDANAQAARQLIEKQYLLLSDAVAAKDLNAIQAVYESGFSEVQATGEEVGLNEAMAEWRNNLDDAIDPKLCAGVIDVSFESGEAHITAQSNLGFAVSPFAGLKYTVRIETAHKDRWVQRDGDWRLRHSEKQLLKWWINDKLDYEQKLEPLLTAEQRANVIADLRLHAHPVDTVLAGNGFDDLAGFDSLIADARIVALGEASHGTAEFFQMKHRLLEYLVEKKGFTVFAIEGNWPEAEAADKFIKTGEGDAAKALEAMYFWTWQTEEVRAMLEWMRAYNAKRGSRPALSFAGFDMQFASVAIKRVTGFFERIGGDDLDAVRSLYDGIEKLDGNSGDATADEKSHFKKRAAQTLALVENRREDLLKFATREEYRDIRQAARIVLQAAEMRNGVPWVERDRAMADNVRWLLEERFPGEKIVLWAHNGHIGTSPIGGEKSQGMHLRELYGRQMSVLGFASDRGEVRAKRIAEGKFQPGPPVAMPLDPAKEVSAEGLFREAELPAFLLDFRRLPKESPLGEWLDKPRLHRSIGSGFDPENASGNYTYVNLMDTYDGLIFIEQCTAAKPLN